MWLNRGQLAGPRLKFWKSGVEGEKVQFLSTLRHMDVVNKRWARMKQ